MYYDGIVHMCTTHADSQYLESHSTTQPPDTGPPTLYEPRSTLHTHLSILQSVLFSSVGVSSLALPSQPPAKVMVRVSVVGLTLGLMRAVGLRVNGSVLSPASRVLWIALSASLRSAPL